ncbi:vomeronasal 1 receptor ornAnaV1R3256 [Ornithorhynchus anatinus]|uniref:Vomeronasal type-1 receptor n=1 Tax=Ornithorhynchus anatinus TaxID=9258 RepID=F7DBY0_ORNAN|nr:vomeronasal 1 receptor ornAnaV1R3256 [Ornithorhynchus anatinus]
MLWSDLGLGIFSLLQTGIGLLGNSALLIVYVKGFISQTQRKKPTDLILSHLIVANTVTLLTQGTLASMLTFQMENHMEENGCRVILYIRRVSRGLSICTTCLLSVFQAVTISPSTSLWATIKYRAPNYILPSFLFFWILNLLMYTDLLRVEVATKNVNITVKSCNIKYCFNIFWMHYLNYETFLSAITLRDVLFVLLMSWASCYMVTVLYRHRKQVQHIHSTSSSSKSSAETRATHTILLLVSCFVCFYWINCSINLASSFLEEDDFRLNNTATFLGACYPSVCPLVLINSEPRVPKIQCVLEKGRGFFFTLIQFLALFSTQDPSMKDPIRGEKKQVLRKGS